MIDWSRVEELVDEIGAEDFGEVVELFLSEVEGAIAAFEAAEGNPVVAEEQLHFLKGAALNLGFETLAQLCLKGEKAAAAGRADVVSPAEVREVYETSRDQFQADLPNRLAA
ncbi:Hpt domain-containing protein [Tropicibacter naphthalenivorans]|uniref:TMAO reductase sytem sensor TorS n=1 Tax=Tropicibacter naphthalenivorans TaxID=441103 RepID=A0A0P1H0H7_9RHOB|nr:Hpt domain-containing protein [Tropicibacter naphthalenivorans]CUH79607.1 TMAO reductase sytem sensor TorS [Tropicibacter naphthalenivorans]SMC73725.1 Hpt domain-containing protein [Tropicibacter naphthalenivorans]